MYVVYVVVNLSMCAVIIRDLLIRILKVMPQGDLHIAICTLL